MVLDAVGIASEVTNIDGRWRINVADEAREPALNELKSYQEERQEDLKPKPPPVRVFGGAVAGVVGYLACELLIASVSNSAESRPIWLGIGRADATAIAEGQWWRCATALTLHADAGHLLSNLGYGSVFGFLVGRILGGGIGWLAIFVGGCAGNLLNNLMRNGDHLSIGASTAVFAALGILVAHALKPRSSNRQTAFQRWRPLIAGLILLSLTGIGGENTDVGAHAMGFFAGFVLGWIACRIPDDWLASTQVQIASGSAAVTMLVTAWALAIATA